MKFSELPVKSYFKLDPEGRSFLKTSPFGYYVDSVMGEIQVQAGLDVIPFDLPDADVPKN